jgi:hypothetical protein
MKFFDDLFFRLNKPKVIILGKENQKFAREAIFEVLKSHFKIGKEVLIFEAGPGDREKIKFLVNNSSLPILALTDVSLLKGLPKNTKVILNFDDEKARSLKNQVPADFFTFSSQQEADLQASDIVANGEVNFKINYSGSSVPVWLFGTLDNEKIQAALLAAACGLKLGLNLVEISQALKNFKAIDKG